MGPYPWGVDAARWGFLLSPVAAFSLNVIAHILLMRARRGADFLRTIAGGFVLGLMALAAMDALCAARFGDRREAVILSLLVNLPTYIALSFCYFSGIANLGRASIRLRIHGEISSTPGGMNITEVERIYGDGRFTEMRVQRLVESGDILEKEGRYFVGRKRFVHVANIMTAAKQFLFGKKSEFE